MQWTSVALLHFSLFLHSFCSDATDFALERISIAPTKSSGGGGGNRDSPAIQSPNERQPLVE